MGRRLELGQGDPAAREGGPECGRHPESAHFAGRRRRGDQACNRAPGWPGHSCRPFVRRCRDQRRRQRPEGRRPCLCSGVRSGCGRGGRRARQGISAGSRRRRAAAGRGRVPDDDDEGCPGKLCPGSTDAERKLLAATQGPTNGAAFGAKLTNAAWKTKSTWYVVAANDRMIPPDLERKFARTMKAKTIELATSHVAMLSRPAEVAKLIVEAAKNAPPQ